MTLPVINAIWIGDMMGPIHAACLKSFIITGHKLVLHAYDEVADAPDGVIYADANRLMPRDRLMRHSNGSYALSSDVMRYELLRQGLGLYIDCDVFCLRPMEDADVVFGREDDWFLNGAVLKLPVDSPMLADLCSIQEGWIPPWRDRSDEPPRSLTDLPWGVAGPRAISYYAEKHGMMHLALDRHVFYPVHYTLTDWLFDPAVKLSEIIAEQTKYVHLYNNTAMKTRPDEIPPTSPLGEMLAMVA